MVCFKYLYHFKVNASLHYSFFNLKSLFLLYRSDPTENDSIEGLRPNARGPGLVTFGVREVLQCIKTEYILLFVKVYTFIKVSSYHLKLH